MHTCIAYLSDRELAFRWCFVISGDFAFIAEKSWFMVESATDCDLTMSKETFFPTNYAWAMKKGSLLTPIFNERSVENNITSCVKMTNILESIMHIYRALSFAESIKCANPAY